MMYARFHTVTVRDDSGNNVEVALRFTALSNIKLKKKYNVEGRALFISAFDDDERLIDILNESLNWKDNENAIKSGVELFERIVDTDGLGVFSRQKLLVNIATASGIFDDDERDYMLSAIEEDKVAFFNRKIKKNPEAKTEKNA